MNEKLANVFNAKNIQSYRFHCQKCGGNLTPTRGIFTCREFQADIDRRDTDADALELCVSAISSASTLKLLPESSFQTTLFLSCPNGHVLRLDVAFEAGGTEVIVGEPNRFTRV